MDRLAQMLADGHVLLGDPEDRPADGLPHRYPRPFALIGEGSGATAEPGGAGQLGDEPVPLGPGPGHPAGTVTRVWLAELSVEALQPVPVLRYRLVVEDRLGWTVVAAGPAEASQPRHQVGQIGRASCRERVSVKV